MCVGVKLSFVGHGTWICCSDVRDSVATGSILRDVYIISRMFGLVMILCCEARR